MRKGRPWYFLSPSYWCGASWRPRRHAGVRTARGERSLRPPLARGAALDAGTQRDTGGGGLGLPHCPVGPVWAGHARLLACAACASTPPSLPDPPPIALAATSLCLADVVAEEKRMHDLLEQRSGWLGMSYSECLLWGWEESDTWGPVPAV